MKWIRQLVELSRKLLKLRGDVEKNKSDIEELRGELKELAKLVSELSVEIRLIKQKQSSDVEKVELMLENAVLKFGARADRLLRDSSRSTPEIEGD